MATVSVTRFEWSAKDDLEIRPALAMTMELMRDNNSDEKRSPQMAEEKQVSLVIEVLHKVADVGINGCKFLSSSKELAQEYVNDKTYLDNDARVAALSRWEDARSFAVGVITGLGGLLTLPVGIPADLGCMWVVQTRLAGAIAEIYGHDSREDRVRTFALCCLLGNAGKEAIKRAGVSISQKAGAVLVSKIPGRVFTEINKKVGFRLVTKAGEKGVVNVIRLVPLLGGAVGGTVDAIATHTVGKIAAHVFRSLRADDGG